MSNIPSNYEGAYDDLLNALSAPQWERIGIKRRSGVVAPLFSIYSSKSAGIGDLFDLKLVIDWCRATGMSIIQLLPMNDVGFNFRPYDAQSTFALEPMYLSLEGLAGVDLSLFRHEIKKIKKDFSAGTKRVDYRIKSAKLCLLWKIFQKSAPQSLDGFKKYLGDNAYWLEDYALFKVIKEKNNETAWETWDDDLRYRRGEALLVFKETHQEALLFHEWLQWQLFEQFRRVKAYAEYKKVLLMGDLPFLVARDSVDVWAHQDYFKLDLSAGAPPDMLYSKGQRWGMPPYHWENIGRHGYDYLKEKLKYAQNFYDLYRIDHVVGIFRLWTIPLAHPLEQGGLHGSFDPANERLWEEHGRNLLSVMIKNTSMLACAEDLGTIPPCSFKVLNELGIPGIDVQRWMRDWGKTYTFKDPSVYRKYSMATIASHDMSSLHAWWMFEAGTVDEELFKRKCREKGISFDEIVPQLFDLDESFHGRLRWRQDVQSVRVLLEKLRRDEASVRDLADLYEGSFDEKVKFTEFLGLGESEKEAFSPLFVKRVLEKIASSVSIFSIQLMHDWLSLDALFDCDPWELRINFPGTMGEKNWSLVMPVSLEDILALPVNSVIKNINEQSERV